MSDAPLSFATLAGLLPLTLPADTSVHACRTALAALLQVRGEQLHLLPQQGALVTVVVAASFLVTCHGCGRKLECSCEHGAASKAPKELAASLRCDCVPVQEASDAAGHADSLCPRCLHEELFEVCFCARADCIVCAPESHSSPAAAWQVRRRRAGSGCVRRRAFGASSEAEEHAFDRE